MTDTYTPESQFAAPAQPAPSQFVPQLNLGRIDSNLRQIDTIQRSWRLPSMPDETRLDLATMPGSDHDSLGALLWGLDDDVHRDDETGEAPPPAPFPQPELTGIEQARVIMASLSSNPAPEQVSDNAVKQFKLRAINRGLLDMDPARVDSSWSPEFNRVRGEMAFDDYNDRMRGDRPGAVPMSSVLGFINTVTSPTGLLAMATDLDLFWDFGAIGDEMSSWGDKWRKLGDSKGPFDFAKNLVDALTGPIDDIVFPVLNVGLMFMGVGAVTNSLRIGWMGARVVEGTNIFTRLYRGTRVTENVAELGRMSWTATKLTGAGRGIQRGTQAWSDLGLLSRGAANTGRALEQWRALKPVISTKAVVQQGMRLGLVGAAEQAFPGYDSDGASLSDIPGVGGARDALHQASVSPAFLPLELMFAPYNVFAPGTFFTRGARGFNADIARAVGLSDEAAAKAGLTGLRAVRPGAAQRLGRGTVAALGTAPGRAAAGALLGVAGGAVLGEDAGDIALGAAIGAGAGAAMPLVGEGIVRFHEPVTGALIGAGAGAMLGEDTGDTLIGAAMGGLAGAGLHFAPTSVRNRFIGQAGISAIDKLARGIGTQMVRTNYQLIGRDQEVILGFHKGMQTHFADNPAALDQWNTDVKLSGVVDALAKHQNAGVTVLEKHHRDLAAATITWSYVTASIDWIASAQAAGIKGDVWAAQRMARNKIINQLRPIDLAVSDEQIVDDVAKAWAWMERGSVDANLRAVVAKKNDIKAGLTPQRARLLAQQHNDRVGDTIYQLFNEVNFPKPPEFTPGTKVPGVNQLGEGWAATPMRGRADVLAAHVPRIAGTLGRFDEFVNGAASIRSARLGGLFDDARLVGLTDARGRPFTRQARRAKKASREVVAANEAVTQTLLDPATKVEQLKAASPLAGADEAGRMAMQNLENPTKQMLDHRVRQLRELTTMHHRLRDLVESLGWEKRLAGVKGYDPTRRVDELTQAEFDELVTAVGAIHRRAGDKARDILDFARHRKWSIADLDANLNTAIDEMANSSDWARWGMDSIVTDEAGRVLSGVDALNARVKDLNVRIPHTASEVDLDEAITAMRRTGNEDGVAELEALKAGLDADGKRLVHGVEFIMPEDVAFRTPPFEDVTRRHLNAVSMGNFFGRRHPVEAMIRDDRRRRLAIANALADVGKVVGPEDAEVDRALDVLDTWLRQTQKRVQEDLSLAHTETRVGRTITRLRSSLTPVRLDDVQGRQAQVLDALRKAGYDDVEATAVWKATTKFRNTDFQDVGLYSIEAKLRSQSQIAQSLKFLSGSRYGDELWKRSAGTAVTGATVGAVVGAAGAGGEATFEERLAAAVKGGVVGGVVAAGVPAVYAGAGKAVHKAFNARGTAAKLIDRAETNRYTYLADTYARMRDSLRFTLSPFFDLSRYTEGLFLAQTAAPLRNADGSRRVMPLNASPRGLRNRLRTALEVDDDTNVIRQQLVREGHLAKGRVYDPAEAKVVARQLYDRRIREFNDAALAGKDFDVDAIDQAGRWFRQVGILGFSPTEWMGTAYATLRTQGVDAEGAYEAARCLAPETRVLTADLRYVPVDSLTVGDELVAFDEHPTTKKERQWRSATVEAIGRDVLPSYRVTLDDGTKIVASAGHQWLAGCPRQWMTTETLFKRHRYGGNKAPKVIRLLDVWDEDDSRTGGYLAGMFDGEGCVIFQQGLRLAMAQRQNEAMHEAQVALKEFGFDLTMCEQGNTGAYTVTIRGGRPESLRFLGSIRPARLLARYFGKGGADSLGTMHGKRVGVASVEFLGDREVVTVQTSTRTLVAEGFAHHNSMYNYGTRGRWAAELSVNFIMFPFSFQKKALTHMAMWVNDDIGRSIIIHDALKTYEILDQRYDLDEKWRDRMPFITQLSRLNLFAYGLSPGRLGGINSQLMESAGKVAWNMFVPVGANVRDASAGKELTDLTKSLLPVINDVNWMLRDVRDVAIPVAAGAFGASTAINADAQARKGYEEWYAFKNALDAQLQTRGYSLDDIHTKPWLADLEQMYQNKQAELKAKYPFWYEAKTEAFGNIMAENSERQMRLYEAGRAASMGVPTSPDNMMLAQFEDMLANLKREMKLRTGSSSFDDANPAIFDAILRQSATFARQNPGWISLWNKFYRREFGPIEMIMELS